MRGRGHLFRMARVGVITSHNGGDSDNGLVCTRASNEGYPKVFEDFTITEKALLGPSPG